MSSVASSLWAAASLLVVVAACSSSNEAVAPPDGGGGNTCETAKVEKDAYCESCTMSPGATPASCRAPRTVNACCTWVTPPTQPLTRSTGLHRYSDDNPAIQLGCLDKPAVKGTPKTFTLTGHVRLFSSGNDSTGVKIEIYKEKDDESGALGELVGTPTVTTNSDTDVKREDWLKKCPEGGCIYRSYTYANVPTETRLIVKTSDATGGQQWAAFYDYGLYFSNSEVTGDIFEFEPSAVAATDLNTVASAAGGFSLNASKGLLAGEVHDCDDKRLAGAAVDIDAAHESDMLYFGENEADPLPDKTRGSAGTSKLGLFGTLNVTTGVAIRVSAVGNYNGQTVLLGHHVVQTFPGAVTALRLRGRRPWQLDPAPTDDAGLPKQ